MYEFMVVNGNDIDSNILRHSGAMFCDYWQQWVLYTATPEESEALTMLENVGITDRSVVLLTDIALRPLRANGGLSAKIRDE